MGILMLLAAIVLLAVGFLAGRAHTDDKTAQLLLEERHRRVTAEEVLRATCEKANAELFIADLRIRMLQESEAQFIEHLVRCRRGGEVVNG